WGGGGCVSTASWEPNYSSQLGNFGQPLAGPVEELLMPAHGPDLKTTAGAAQEPSRGGLPGRQSNELGGDSHRMEHHGQRHPALRRITPKEPFGGPTALEADGRFN